MRGTTLATLLTMLKAEVGYSLDSTATGKDAALIQLLANKQRWLAGEYDWPFLEHQWDLSCAISSRYLDIPTVDVAGSTVTINFERPVLVEVKFTNRWIGVDYGVGAQQYNAIDSDDGQTLDPIQNWRFATDSSETANPNHIEIWPMPATVQTLRFTGQRSLQELIATTDVADLDDTLIVAFTAIDLVPQEERSLKATAAQERLRRVLGGYPRKTRRLVFGKTDLGLSEKKQNVVPVIAVHG
jgi:hypothetical protein